MNQLALSFREQIESNQSKSKALDQTIKRVVLEKLNLTRATGLILEDAEAVLDPATFAEVTAGIGGEAVQRFISFSRKYREEISDFGPGFKSAFVDALRTSGALPMPTGFGEQVSHDLPNFLQWSARIVMDYKVRFAKFLAAKPLSSWGKKKLSNFCLA